MMTNVDEKFFAWLDGELSDTEAAEMEARVAAEPELAALAEQHRALGARLGSAFDPIAAAPVPKRIASTLRPSSNVVDLDQARSSRQAVAPRARFWAQAATIAATLVMGVVIGTVVAPGSGSSPVAPEAGRLVAAASLENALYGRLASAPMPEGPRIQLTFRSDNGSICRTFTDGPASGLACHEGGDWRIRGLVQSPEGQQGEYRMAAGPDPSLAAMVESTISGEAFDAEQERQAMQRGWR
jgi:hypothetical protein